jgi:hypothetical protein
MKLLRSLTINAIGFTGVGLVAYGVSLWSMPSAIVFGGVVLIATAIISALPTRPNTK